MQITFEIQFPPFFVDSKHPLMIPRQHTKFSTVHLGGRELGTLWVTHRSQFFPKIKIRTSSPYKAHRALYGDEVRTLIFDDPAEHQVSQRPPTGFVLSVYSFFWRARSDKTGTDDPAKRQIYIDKVAGASVPDTLSVYILRRLGTRYRSSSYLINMKDW